MPDRFDEIEKRQPEMAFGSLYRQDCEWLIDEVKRLRVLLEATQQTSAEKPQDLSVWSWSPRLSSSRPSWRPINGA